VNYHFETKEFGLSDNGFHLLRSRFNYQTYQYSDIDSVTIEKGKEINNWIVVLGIGLSMTVFSIWYSFRLLSIFNNGEVNVLFIEEIVVPVIPFLLGLYLIYTSTRNGLMLIIVTKQKTTKRLPLRELENQGNIEDFRKMLDSNLTQTTKNTI
jgi:hypothetical protein